MTAVVQIQAREFFDHANTQRSDVRVFAEGKWLECGAEAELGTSSEDMRIVVRNDDIKIYLDSDLLKMESGRVKTCDFFPGGIDCFREIGRAHV